MRVLCVGNMYPPHHLGGYELAWRTAVGSMRARGHSVRNLASDFRLDAPDPSIPEDAETHRELRWYWRDHEFPRLGIGERIRLERHNAAVLGAHLGGHEPDVVAWWGMGGMSLSLIEAVRRRGIPAVGLVSDDWMVYAPRVDQWTRLGGRGGGLHALAGRAIGVPDSVDLGAAAEWAFVSEATRSAAEASGLRLPRTSIAHTGVEITEFPLRPPGEWRWRLLCVGRIDPRKGLATAVRALALLPAEATLTIAGSGDEQHGRELRALADELGLGPRVEFLAPPRAEIPALYAGADAVLFPVDWEEPWGLVPLEAMATGRPVVATGLGGSGEFLRDGENALVYSPPDSAEALADSIRHLAADPDLVERLRAAGRRTAEANTMEGFGERVADLVERAEG